MKKGNLEKKNEKKKGISIYLAVLMMSILFSISFGISLVSVNRMKALRDIGNSVVAFYAAETGIERALEESNDANYIVTDGYLDLNENGYYDEEDSSYEVRGIQSGIGNCSSSAGYCLKAIGGYKGTKRTIQVQL